MTSRSPFPSVLEFVDSGAGQHVFADRDDRDHVYKLPALFAELLPSRPSVSSFRPTRPWKATAWSLAMRLSHHGLLHAEPALLWHLRRRRVARFRAMLRILEQLRVLGSTAGLLPFEVVNRGKVRLLTPQRARQYEGPLLVQRKADTFIRPAEFPADFESDAVVRIQGQLWTAGVGLDDADTVLGPHNWALLDGRVHLGDTGSLTRRRRHVRSVLQRETLDGVADLVVNRCADERTSAALRSHVARVRHLLDAADFDGIWLSA